MNLEYVSEIKDAFKILKERVVNDLQFHTKVIAKGMENAASLQLWWICCDFIVVVPYHLGVNKFFIEVLALFGFYEQKIKKIHEAFFEFVDEFMGNKSFLVRYIVEGFKEVSFAGSGYHFCFQYLFIEL